MNIGRNIRTVIAAALAIFAAAACKKDDEDEEVLPSLSGQLRFEAESYISKGAKLTMTPSGVTHPEGKGLGYYWSVSPLTEKNDTTKFETDAPSVTGTFSYEFPDSLGTFKVTCSAFASGYYSTSSSKYVTTVDPEESLIDMELGYEGEYGSMTDDRDGRTYRTVQAGNLEWFAENLAYAGTEDEPCGLPYYNAEAMSDVFGRYYTWNEAMEACPDGWHLPSEEDWLDLGNALKDGEAELAAFNIMEGIPGKMMVEASFNSEENQMWEYWPDVKITNESGLAVIPCGFANISYDEKGRRVGTFDSDYYLFAAFWSSDEYNAQTDAIEPSGEDGEAFYRYIYWNAPVLQINYASKDSFATTVRCVRDKQ